VLRPLFWMSLMFAAMLAVIIPTAYFYTASSLPQLDTEFDLLRVLKQPIESERRSMQMNKYNKEKDPVEFLRPDIARFPKELVAFYITERGCPTYFQSPREEGWPWTKRMFGVFAGIEPDGDGWCEKVFADNISRRAGAKGSLEMVVATHKIHRFLKKDGLVAYDLATTPFEDGVIGVEAAAKFLFQKELNQLSLAELAELQLAIPPHGYFIQVKLCMNPNLLRQNRDILLERLGLAGMTAMDKAEIAKKSPLACPSVKR
jgi:Transglycosylase